MIIIDYPVVKGEDVECNVKFFLAYGRDQFGIESLERNETQNALHAAIELDEKSLFDVRSAALTREQRARDKIHHMRRRAFIMRKIRRYTLRP